MKKVVVGAFVVLSLMVFVLGAAHAEKRGGFKGEKVRCEEGGPMAGHMRHSEAGMMGAGHRIWKALADLGLDENQKVAIRGIRTAAKKDAIRKIAEIRIARIELREILDKDSVDMGAVEAKLKQMESLKTDLHMSRIKSMEEIKAKLTPEQREKLKANLRKHFRGHGGCMHGGKGMLPPSDKRERK